jgi:hypothetical protein
MSAKLQTKQVFTPGGQPTVTYIDRAHLGLESALKRAMARGFSIISVTGQTKSGKTVLCRKVVPEKAIWLEAGQIQSEAEFWDQAAFKLNLSQIVTKSQTEEQTGGGAGEVGASFNIGLASVTTKSGGTIQAKSGKTSSSTWSCNNKLQVLEHLLNGDRPLIIDDFHYLNQDIQRSIVQSLKAEVYKGLTVILLSVPHRAFDPVNVEREMQGRFSHIEIPMWSEDDLSEIAGAGFRELKVVCLDDIVRLFAKESFGSPLLMQSFCSNLCLTNDIYEACDNDLPLSPLQEQITSIFSEVSQNFGFPTYQTLRRGPQSRTDRVQRSLAAGDEGDIYEAVLGAVALTGPVASLNYDDIRTALRQVLSDQVPRKHEVVRALGHMSRIAKEDLQGEPVIEWDGERLFITDPFFMFYLKWAVAKQFRVR